VGEGDSVSFWIVYIETEFGLFDDGDALSCEVLFPMCAVSWRDRQREEVPPGSFGTASWASRVTLLQHEARVVIETEPDASIGVIGFGPSLLYL